MLFETAIPIVDFIHLQYQMPYAQANAICACMLVRSPSTLQARTCGRAQSRSADADTLCARAQPIHASRIIMLILPFVLMGRNRR